MHKNHCFIFVLFVILASSCGQYKRYTLLQTSKLQPDTLYKQNFTTYRLQPADIIYVQIKSLNPEITQLFSTIGSSSQMGMGGPYLYGRSIDTQGNIQLPVIGTVYVTGLTMDEARDTIQRRALLFISDAVVETKLLSFKISFLGEMKGQVNVMNDRANILEVLAMSGGVPYAGNPKKLLILRSENGNTRIIHVDLSKRELLSSPLYYLQPNDIIYMEPRKSAAFKLWLSDYTAYLTVFTSVTTLYLFINQFSK